MNCVAHSHLLRRHNKGFKPGDSQTTLLMCAEGAVVLVCLERFLRVVLGAEATEEDTLPNLLEKATGKRLALLKLSANDRDDAIKRVKDVRNTLLHGNYEQAAAQAGCGTVAEYFQTQYAGEIETLFLFLDDLMKQIDPNTGKPYV